MKNKYTLYFLLLIITATSCEKEIEFSPDEFQSEIIVNGIVGKDSTFKIDLGISNSKLSFSDFLDGKRENLDFEVELFENNEFIEKLSRKEFKYFDNGYTNGIPDSTSVLYYESKLKAQSNIEYQIKVKHSELESAFASTSIPNTVPIKNIEKSVEHNQTNNDKSNYIFNINFDDPADEKNYYQLVTTTKLGICLPATNEFYDSTKHQILVFENREGRVSVNSNFIKPDEDADDYLFGSPYNRYNVCDDTNFNGKSCTIELSTDQRYNDNYDLFNLDTINGEFYHLDLSILQITKECYLYLKSVDEQFFNDGNPFIEPNIVYSNIENGVGIFTGYAADKKQVKIGNYPKSENTYIQTDWINKWFR